MDIVNGFGLVSTSELAIIGIGVYFIIQAIKISKIRIANTYLPFVAMGVGIIVGLIIGQIYGDVSLAKAGLAGFLVGGTTAGLFTGFKGITGGYKSNDKH
ncbi:hypothetical protein EGT49_12265 [Companilactobacillus suantsaicola]|uniref:Holin n=1 Tax=Companilactobacillus suantsaicola TaxID=2487723 RepID=A0A4Z0JGX5_9LACO|nr:holin [Companilactobacillus suantsaicola]TGD20923.1 hypothetical protein EGT49_12265 [Companilactobacillus suantsaicola]